MIRSVWLIPLLQETQRFQDMMENMDIKHVYRKMNVLEDKQELWWKDLGTIHKIWTHLKLKNFMNFEFLKVLWISKSNLFYTIVGRLWCTLQIALGKFLNHKQWEIIEVFLLDAFLEKFIFEWNLNDWTRSLFGQVYEIILKNVILNKYDWLEGIHFEMLMNVTFMKALEKCNLLYE